MNVKDYGAKHDMGRPIQLYPLYENGLRAHRNQSIQDNHAESARMYAEFAKVAEKNQYAWNYSAPAQTEQSIKTVSDKNRMICFPCKCLGRQDIEDAAILTLVVDPLLMNAFNTVNLSAACIVTSTEYARQLGIPQERWIYPLGGAGTMDSNECELTNH
jgi:hypothetical protein